MESVVRNILKMRRRYLDTTPSSVKHVRNVGVLGLLLMLGSLVVYFTGGTAYAYPYLMMIPVLLGAAWYLLPGGLIVALVAGVLMALMPLHVDAGTAQSSSNWLIRIAMFMLLGGVAGWLFQSRRQATEERIAVARVDPRSGLPNMVALEEDLLKSLRHRKEGKSVGLMLVRITDITDVMEAMGMDASDELILAMGERLRHAIRGGATAYRFSNAELALIVSDIVPDDLTRIAGRLTEIGEESLQIQQVPIRVQLVMGSSVASEEEGSPESLIHEARIAMFAAIERRLSHSRYSPAFQRRTVHAIQLIARVRKGLAEGEFELHYQPKIRLADGRVCGCEGLIRWRGSDGGLISPGMFMPKVESTTLISPVTRFVVEQACRFAEHETGPGEVSINLSVHNLYDEELLQVIRMLVERLGSRAHTLEVEITESALIGDLEAARQAIQRMRDFGVGVSIDDFGTGFASFEYLRHLPITGLKIDRAFVVGLEEDKRARDLMACMIDVGHALELVVTAEGVETSGQHECLRELGCDQAQGFYFSPALPASEYREWCQGYAARQRLSLDPS
ncbi:putative bifunctional diguanylate cyclase/phosphodiesterase [Halomonas flagellata]|uniref:putative bifunctional diguanylate cyclase/phosphodiesterase n=1 Tax=Halomonas flagellata TaxID=2920385 RepID=UPI001F0A3207|nr:phosphodiesterase [Halomonas flagellata]